MKFERCITNPNQTKPSDTLLIVWAGWGFDSSSMGEITDRTDIDLCVVSDYSSITEAAPQWMKPYKEICILAWSFGVAAATYWLSRNKPLQLTRCVAVNGTPWPVSDTHGIPEAIFNATAAVASNERTLQKFYRRMCGSAKATQQFMNHAPTYNPSRLLAELHTISHLPAPTPHDTAIWNAAYIGANDLIFPPVAQTAAWHTANTQIIETPWPHLPIFPSVIDEEFIDKTLVSHRFTQSAHTYDSHANAQQSVAAKLYNLTGPIPSEAKVLEVGSGTGLLTRLYSHPQLDIELWDIAQTNDQLPGRHTVCDAETAIDTVKPESLDIILSASTIQWFNNPTAWASKAWTKLRHNGTLALATYTPDTFAQLQLAGLPELHRYPSAKQWQQTFEQIIDADTHIEQQQYTLKFDSPHELLRHMSLTGIAARHIGNTRRIARQILKKGIDTLTYSAIFIIAHRH